jgi:WD40 repeat protein
VTEKRHRTTLKGHAAAVRALTFSPDGKTLATGHSDWRVVLWDALTGQERATLIGHSESIDAVSFPADGQTLISLGSEGTVRRWRSGGP